MHRILAPALAAVALAAPAAASAQPAGSVSIGPCTITEHHARAGHTEAHCPVHADPAAGTPITVDYASNLPQILPGGGRDEPAGTLSFTARAPQVRTLSFAFRRATAAQVKRRLAVTLSHASGATIAIPVAKPGHTRTITSMVTFHDGARVKATATVTDPRERLSEWWSARTIVRVVRDAYASGPDLPYTSRGYECRNTGSERHYRCTIRDDTSTSVHLTFSLFAV